MLSKLKQFIKECNYVPFQLKKFTSLIEDKICNFKNSFRIFIDFSNDPSFPISFYLNVNFNQSDKIKNYYSNVNILDAIQKEYRNFEIFVNIEDENIY